MQMSILYLRNTATTAPVKGVRSTAAFTPAGPVSLKSIGYKKVFTSRCRNFVSIKALWLQ